MKTTVVPAQVTTVEDKVAGNLSFTQMILLVIPVFLNGLLYVILPPFFGFSFAKLIIGIALALLCATMAIRVKGKILLQWIAIVSKYKMRPHYYLYNKNDTHLRKQESKLEPAPIAAAIQEVASKPLFTAALTPSQELVRVESAVHDPRANFHISFKKGDLRVHIREIKEESI